MPKCLVCDKQFHWCEPDHNYERYYCSERCYLKSKEYYEESTLIFGFLASLTDEQYEKFKFINEELDEHTLYLVQKEFDKFKWDQNHSEEDLDLPPPQKMEMVKRITLQLIDGGELKHSSLND